MSTSTRYRSWSVTATWAGSAGVGPFAAGHCRYYLDASDLVLEAESGTRYTQDEHAMASRPLRFGDAWRSADLNYNRYTLTFSGRGAGRGASFLPGSAAVAWPSCPGRGSRIWHEGQTAWASRFRGHGFIIDFSCALGSGIGLQILVFNMDTNIFRDIAFVHDLVRWISNGDSDRLRQYIPMGGVCFGVQFGASIGVTVYQGGWWTRERQVVLPEPPNPNIGRALPPSQRPTARGPSAQFENRRINRRY